MNSCQIIKYVFIPLAFKSSNNYSASLYKNGVLLILSQQAAAIKFTFTHVTFPALNTRMKLVQTKAAHSDERFVRSSLLQTQSQISSQSVEKGSFDCHLSVLCHSMNEKQSFHLPSSCLLNE